jgi:hypothetical protein
MSTITLNAHAFPWTNWTQTGLSRFAFAGATANANAGLSFGAKTVKNQVDASVQLSSPVVATVDSVVGPVGTLLRAHYTTIRRQLAPTATFAERTEELARLRSLVLTSQFESWFLYDTLPT